MDTKTSQKLWKLWAGRAQTNDENVQHIRWPEQLPTFRKRFTRNQWKDYIGEISYKISYENADGRVLTSQEYNDVWIFMTTPK